jgi:repressor LexA
MMARKAKKGLSEKHKKILSMLETFTEENGYPPSIREICSEVKISSTSVANYYLERLEKLGYIERERRVSRGLRLIKPLSEISEIAGNATKSIRKTLDEILQIPMVGTIVASEPVTTYEAHPDTMIDVARSLMPVQKTDDLFALTVSGDSMIDAMVNDGDIVIMRPAQEPIQNGDMVAVWLNNKDETTLKYFYLENGRVRLQPANPTMQPIFIDDPETVEIQGQVVMVVRQMEIQ